MSRVTRKMPRFRGLGRCIIAVDKWLRNRSTVPAFEVIARINGRCKLVVDTRIIEQLFAYYYGEWEKDLLSAALAHFRGGAFYDIGGSIGLYAVTIGDHCRDHGGYVRTVEPLPLNLVRLRRNLELNGLDERWVRVEERGLSDRAGTLHLAAVANGIPGNAKVVAHGGLVARVTTLDELWAERQFEPVGFVKIDTEGFDVPILGGAVRLLTTCRPNLLVEFNRERMRNLRFDIGPSWRLLVEELGYRCRAIADSARWTALEQPGEHENLLFLRPSER